MSARHSVDVAIAGAGAAGLAAALAARRAGARVLVIDGFPQAGGQYFAQPMGTGKSSAQAAEGERRIAACRAAGVAFLFGSEIVAAYPGFTLLTSGEGTASAMIEARALIAATGAHERTLAFPGWTLPGVMNAGAGQRLMKVSGVAAGQRVVIAGTGIFLWAVAETLATHGVGIAALVEARQPSAALLGHLARHPESWAEAARLVRTVRSRTGKVLWGHMIESASGHGRVETLSVVPVGGGTSRRIDGIDALLVSHGFQPNIELTSLLGCGHAFDDAIGGWHAVAGEDGETSVPGLFAAGEVTGIAGARPALLAGELAGHAAARHLGFAPVADFDAAAARRQLARARGFGQGLMRLFAPLAALERVQKDDTILCRCEEVTRGDILSACRDGASDLHAVKTWTRAGMGRCQGRMCRMSLTACMAGAIGTEPPRLGFNHPRIPLRPVPIDRIMAASDALTKDDGAAPH